jgi:NAD(P)-dependent dehydrogenase (short-subunit alcohol dehydrogenase family)
VGRPVCPIVGAGAGIGGHVAKRSAREGYHACLARRRDQAGLHSLAAEIEAQGGSASGHLLDAEEEGGIEQLLTHVEASIGPSAGAAFNRGAQIGDRGLASTLLVTSATAAMRGNAGQHSHAAAMGGRRWSATADHPLPGTSDEQRDPGVPLRRPRPRLRRGYPAGMPEHSARGSRW